MYAGNGRDGGMAVCVWIAYTYKINRGGRETKRARERITLKMAAKVHE